MVFSALIAIGMQKQLMQPVLWLHPNGQVLVEGQEAPHRLTEGARRIKTTGGTFLYAFDGTRGGVLLPDLEPLKITSSITVSVWLNLRSYVNDGPGAQILFRGDDRNGLDPYTLTLRHDGTITFNIVDAHDRWVTVKAEIPLNQWVHVVGSYHSGTGVLRLWLNGEDLAHTTTSWVPFRDLDTGTTPGIGIGNVQNQGRHNQPLNGQIADLRLYRGAFTPDEIGSDWKIGQIPPASKAGGG